MLPPSYSPDFKVCVMTSYFESRQFFFGKWVEVWHSLAVKHVRLQAGGQLFTIFFTCFVPQDDYYFQKSTSNCQTLKTLVWVCVYLLIIIIAYWLRDQMTIECCMVWVYHRSYEGHMGNGASRFKNLMLFLYVSACFCLFEMHTVSVLSGRART